MCAHWLYFVYFGREVDAVIMSWAGALHPTDIISIEFDVDGRWGGGGLYRFTMKVAKTDGYYNCIKYKYETCMYD